jgi:hypothetical protein
MQNGNVQARSKEGSVDVMKIRVVLNMSPCSLLHEDHNVNTHRSVNIKLCPFDKSFNCN